MSCSDRRGPLAPALVSEFVCLATSRSVCAVGVKDWRFAISPSALDARSVDRRDERVVAGLCEQQATVLGDHPSGAPGDVVTGRAVDVRHVVAVAQHRHAGMRHGLGCRSAR